MFIDIRNLVQRLIRLEQTNRNRVALASGLKAQSLSSWLNNIVPNYISFERQQNILAALGVRMHKDHLQRPNFDLARGRLLHWVVTLRPKDQPEVATLDDVRFVLEACGPKLEYMKVFRYQGSPSHAAVLTDQWDTPQVSVWIHLRLDDLAREAETLDALTLGSNEVTNLSAGAWFEGVNGGRVEIGRMDEAFQGGGRRMVWRQR